MSFETCLPGTLLACDDRAAELRRLAREAVAVDLDTRQLCDLEMLLTGGFAPLTGYLGRADRAAVLRDMRLADGRLWPMPLSLDLDEAAAARLSPGSLAVLRDREGFALAALTVEELWRPDAAAEARALFGDFDPAGHPGLARWLLRAAERPWLVSGRVEGLALPQHFDAVDLRLTPAETLPRFARMGWRNVLGCHAERPLHRAERDALLAAARHCRAGIFVQAVADEPLPLEVGHFVRVRCFREFFRAFPPGVAQLGLAPLAGWHAGPREVLWHALVRGNYGCTHFAVDERQCSPNGSNLYPEGEAMALLARHAAESGVAPVALEPQRWSPAARSFAPAAQAGPDDPAPLDPAELRRRLDLDLEVPDWFTFPGVLEELRQAYPPRHRQGFTVFFTGLSGAGKSTLAKILHVKLLEIQHRPVTLLDGDIVRTHLSKKLGFSREDREINVQRIGFVASEITKNGGIAICAPIAPYETSRRINRELIAQGGGYVEVFVSTPLSVCEGRDPKGLYAKARAGLVRGVTGVDDPYEPPAAPDLVVDASDLSPAEGVRRVLDHLEALGYIH
ncbi:MAG: adenylyl-sulfate kinase [Desulfovibrionaceae bacterium]